MRQFMGGLRYLPMIMQAYADAQSEQLLRLRDTSPRPPEENRDDAKSVGMRNAPIKQTVSPPLAKRSGGKRSPHPVSLEKRHTMGKRTVGTVPDLAWRQVLQELRTTRQRLRDLEQIKRELQSIQSRLPDLVTPPENPDTAVSQTDKE
ncbi:MAG: hypothetical protein OWU32_03165 [Firmicutes bacterium]|nr:hypothetical protein [Bacillota bacterium]